MTTQPLVRYGARNGALPSGLTPQLHHVPGHDRLGAAATL
jgi:hypothetical protein